eukprot:4693081-Amphidinium_carterae.1
MAPSYGQTTTPAEGEEQPGDVDVKYIKWVLVNLIINQETLDGLNGRCQGIKRAHEGASLVPKQVQQTFHRLQR